MLQWIGKYWRKRQRNIDRDILFPFLYLQSAHNLQRYEQAALRHIEVDSAWSFADEWMFRGYNDVFGNILTRE